MILGIIIYLAIGFSLTMIMAALIMQGVSGGFEWGRLFDGIVWWAVALITLFYPLGILYLVGMLMFSLLKNIFAKLKNS